MSKSYSKPFLPIDLIERPRLTHLLNKAHGATFISAPGGYGKSVAVNQWLDTQTCNAIWVSLNNSHDEFYLFFEEFIAALQHSNTGLPFHSKKYVHSLEISEEFFIKALLQDINSISTKTVVVVDDFQFIRNKLIHAAISTIIGKGNSLVRLVIISRNQMPPAMFGKTLYDQIHKIDQYDLSLTSSELELLLESDDNKNVKGSDLQHIMDKSEGWILGVKILLALRLKGGNFAAKIPSVYDEIHILLNQLTESIRPELKEILPFLALSDHFSEKLVQDLLEEIGIMWTYKKGIIQTLIESNTFLIQSDDQWYRFHHLFADFLKSELNDVPQETIRKITTFLTKWFERKGLIFEAIKYAISSKDTNSAVKLIGKHRLNALNEEKWWLVQRWLNMLPGDVKKSNTDLLLAQVFIYEDTWQLKEIPAILDLAETNIDEQESPELYSEYLYHRGFIALFMKSDPGEARKLFMHSKKLNSNIGILSSRRNLFLAMARQRTGELAESIPEIELTINHKNEINSNQYLRTLLARTFVQFLDGNLLEAGETLKKYTFLARDCPYHNLEAYSNYFSGNLYFQKFSPKEALYYFNNCHPFVEKMNYRLYLDAVASTAFTHSISYQFDKANESLSQLQELVSSLREVTFYSFFESAEARVKWISGQGQIMLSWAEMDGDRLHSNQAYYLVDVPAITQVRILLTYGNDRQRKLGLYRLQLIEEELKKFHNRYHTLDIQLLHALAHFQNHDHVNARKYLLNVLVQSHTCQLYRPIVEFYRAVPSLFNLTDIIEIPSDIRPLITGDILVQNGEDDELTPKGLSIREAEIVTHVAKGLRNREIAEILNISEVTVKSHLTNIFKKLDVKSRSEMARRSRLLGYI